VRDARICELNHPLEDFTMAHASRDSGAGSDSALDAIKTTFT
jgi:hypothetical protein